MLGKLMKIAAASGAATAYWMTNCDELTEKMEKNEDVSPFFDEKYAVRSAWDEAVDNTDFSKFKQENDSKEKKKNDDERNGDKSKSSSYFESMNSYY